MPDDKEPQWYACEKCGDEVDWHPDISDPCPECKGNYGWIAVCIESPECECEDCTKEREHNKYWPQDRGQ